MNPEQLWDTTMDPANRTLFVVTIEDAAEADRTFSMLMGDEVAPRKRFIQSHAQKCRTWTCNTKKTSIKTALKVFGKP
jgi:DNA gyrase subunit B